jgi:uncharacterized metal-binding protein YceD (DUF177 family)
MTGEAPFSRLVRVEPLPRDGLTQTIEADAAERARLAALCNLAAIGALTASFTLRKSGRNGVRVTGQVHAEVTQTCVVSLEPFEAVVDEPIDVRYASEPPRRKDGDKEPETVDFEAEDPPDPIVDGRIDLGALAAEFLELALDPYPRKPGVAFASVESEPEAGSPFQALADSGKKDGEKH